MVEGVHKMGEENSSEPMEVEEMETYRGTMWCYSFPGKPVVEAFMGFHSWVD